MKVAVFVSVTAALQEDIAEAPDAGVGSRSKALVAKDADIFNDDVLG